MENSTRDRNNRAWRAKQIPLMPIQQFELNSVYQHISPKPETSRSSRRHVTVRISVPWRRHNSSLVHIVSKINYNHNFRPRSRLITCLVVTKLIWNMHAWPKAAQQLQGHQCIISAAAFGTLSDYRWSTTETPVVSSRRSATTSRTENILHSKS